MLSQLVLGSERMVRPVQGRRRGQPRTVARAFGLKKSEAEELSEDFTRNGAYAGARMRQGQEMAQFVTDDHRIQVFTFEGQFIHKWDMKDIKPFGITVDDERNLFVTDYKNHCIHVFSY